MNHKTDSLLEAATKILTGNIQLDEAIDKSDYREVSRAFNTFYGAFSPVSTFYKSLLKTKGISKSDLEKIHKHVLDIDDIWREIKGELDESTIAEAAPKGDNLQKLNDISKIIADVEKNLRQLEKQRDLAQKEYDNVEADLYDLIDKRENLHDMLKYSNLGFSKSQIDKAYKGKL